MKGQPLHFEQLSKSFGRVQAVKDLTFTVEPGKVTGFLGPNGAGKTTTLRMLLGLIRPSEGRATVGGLEYAQLDQPTAVVGSHLSSDAFQPGRTGRDHLKVMAAGSGLAGKNIPALLQLVNLSQDADRKVGGYSLGMRQRLGLAAALLGDPGVLVLDEPANGLDPEGISWLRGFLRTLAAEGRTVFLSSHLLGEIQQMAHDVVIINHGRLITHGSVAELEAQAGAAVLVGSPDADYLAQALQTARFEVEFAAEEQDVSPQLLRVPGATAEQVGQVALAAGVALTHLSEETTGLEDVFLSLVGGPR